jgi:hypothetical protein
MPELDMNLLSLYVLNEKSLNTIFNFKDYLIRKKNNNNSVRVILKKNTDFLSSVYKTRKPEP